ncbi:MAG TPA: RNA-binding protein [Bacteroidales bacterium]|nr:MAG: hypothetical protein A2W98_04730 [Bacteroidetes bacterium GWF2_33_38]HBF88708.1 RNA-binding protein [Bacteroidales bacterium]
MIKFNLNGHEYIELNKLLKVLQLVESGGVANTLITEGEVKLNGKIETQKRKKLVIGDKIIFFEKTIVIVE